MTNRERTKRIRELNDQHRQAPGMYGKWVVTQGFRSLTREQQSRAMEAVQKFNNFSKGNDPYGEHDFGSFDIDGVLLYWKIDYYDKSYDMGSDDPANPNVTGRLMTVFLASEY